MPRNAVGYLRDEVGRQIAAEKVLCNPKAAASGWLLGVAIAVIHESTVGHVQDRRDDGEHLVARLTTDAALLHAVS